MDPTICLGPGRQGRLQGAVLEPFDVNFGTILEPNDVGTLQPQKSIPGGPTSNKIGPTGIRTRDLRQYTLASPLS